MTGSLWRKSGPLAVCLTAIVAVVPTATQARPLDKTSCSELAAERVSLARDHGIEQAIMKGPEWTRANMPDGTFDRVRRYLEVESDLRFRCRGKKPPWLIAESEKEAEKKKKTAATSAAGPDKKAALTQKKKKEPVKAAFRAPLPLRNPKPMAERQPKIVVAEPQPEIVVAEKAKPTVQIKAAVMAMPKLPMLNGESEEAAKPAASEPTADPSTTQATTKPEATEVAAVNGLAETGDAKPDEVNLEPEDPVEKAKLAALRADVPAPDRKPKKKKRRYVKKKKKPRVDSADVADRKLQQQVFPASR